MSTQEKPTLYSDHPYMVNLQHEMAQRQVQPLLRDRFSWKTCTITVLAFTGTILAGRFIFGQPQTTVAIGNSNHITPQAGSWTLTPYKEYDAHTCSDPKTPITGTHTVGCTAVGSDMTAGGYAFAGNGDWKVCFYIQNNCNGSPFQYTDFDCSPAPTSYRIVGKDAQCPGA